LRILHGRSFDPTPYNTHRREYGLARAVEFAVDHPIVRIFHQPQDQIASQTRVSPADGGAAVKAVLLAVKALD
jgi:hypothetical protein